MSELIKSSLWKKKQAAEYLEISVSTLDRLVKDGVIKATRLRGSVRFKREDLDNPAQIERNLFNGKGEHVLTSKKHIIGKNI